MNAGPKGTYSGLDAKVVLITGASSGIGAGCAEVFAAQGSSLVLCGRNVAKLQETQDKCQALGLSAEQILQVPGDVSQQTDLEAYVSRALEKFGRLDVVVANAGIVEAGSVDELTLDKYDHQQNVNLKSVFSLLKLTLPELRKTKGNFIAVSSVASQMKIPSSVAYCVSKAGLDHLIKCVALENAPQGVRVNNVNPGMIYTDIFRRSGKYGEDCSLEVVDKLAAATHPIGRCGNVYETGKAIAFLASDDASFITGVTLEVDGGVALVGPFSKME